MKALLSQMMAVAVIVLVILYSATPAFAPGVSTGGPVRLTGLDLQQVTASGNNVYAIWKDYDRGMLLFARSDDNGHTFHESENLSNVGGQAHIAVSGSNVYLAWISSVNGINELVFRRSIDNGVTFGDLVTLAWNTRGLDLQQLVTSGNNVYVVWTDNSIPYVDRFIASTDNGRTFGKVVDLAERDHSSFDAFIAAMGNKVYAVWEPNVAFTLSNDSGKTFGRIMHLTNDTKDGFSTNTRMAISGGNAYVVWQYNGFGYGKILFRKSADNGNTFGTILSFNNNGQMGYPHVEASGNNVYLFWQSHNNETNDIIFAASNDNGSTFSKPINLSSNIVYSVNYYLSKQIATEGKNVYVAWSASRFGVDGWSGILFRKSTDGGNTFDSVVALSNLTSSFMEKPQVAASQNNVHVAWQGQPEQGGTHNLLFRASNDRGNSFGDAKVLYSSSSSSPPVAPSGSLTVKTDKQTYLTGGKVEISGKVAMVQAGKRVLIQVYDPTDALYRSEEVDVAEDGSYAFSLNLVNKQASAGEYMVKATYDLDYPINDARTVFTYVVPYDVIVNDRTYPINYTITLGKLNSITADAEEKSLIINVNSVGPGTLIIDLPRSLIDSTQDNLDAAFTIFINSKHEQFNYREIYTDASKRTLEINLPYSEQNQQTSEIRIVGTHVIPEFPVNLMAITAIGLIGALVILRMRFNATHKTQDKI